MNGYIPIMMIYRRQIALYDFDEKQMTAMLLKSLEEYAKNANPILFVKVENGKMGGFITERKYNVWFHRICLENYLSKKFYEHLQESNNNKKTPFLRFYSKFEHENKEKIDPICQDLATKSMNLAE